MKNSQLVFFKKPDLLVYTLVLVVLVCSFFLWGRVQGETGGFAVVSVNGTERTTLPLGTDTEVVVEGFAGLNCTVCVADGAAYVTDADCPDKLCAKHSPISRTGESIVCLPARITVTIRGADTPEVDGVAR